MAKGRNHLITLPRVVVIQSNCFSTALGPFLIQIWFSFSFQFEFKWFSKRTADLGDFGGLTAFGSSLRKLFRIHFLSPLFIVPLDYLTVFSFGAFLSSSCRLYFIVGAFIPPKCFDKFPWKVGRGRFPIGKLDNLCGIVCHLVYGLFRWDEKRYGRFIASDYPILWQILQRIPEISFKLFKFNSNLIWDNFPLFDSNIVWGYIPIKSKYRFKIKYSLHLCALKSVFNVLIYFLYCHLF